MLAAKTTSTRPTRQATEGPASRRDSVPTLAPAPVQRKAACACGGSCPRCRASKPSLRISQPSDRSEREADAMAQQALDAPLGIARKALSSASPPPPPELNEALRHGRPMVSTLRADMESRFGTDFSRVRLHTGEVAQRSARELNAAAYTVGHDIVIGAGQGDLTASSGRRLLAHELAHVVQQGGGVGDAAVQRQCLTGAASCPPQICGDPGAYDSSADADEAAGRAARGTQATTTPGAVTASGHGRAATHLRDLALADGITLSGIHGIFVDLDMVSGAWTGLCRNFVGWVPPYSGPFGGVCIFVPDDMERQAEAYLALSPSARRAYAPWLTEALNTIRHEVQHLVYDRSAHAPIAGATCSRTTVIYTSASGQAYNVQDYLSELSAILAEFPLTFDLVRRRTPAGDYGLLLRNLQAAWRHNVFNCDESIRGVFTALKCRCPCADVDAYVRDTFNFTTAGSTATATIPGMPAWDSTTTGVFLDLMRSMFPTVGWP